MAKDTKSKLLEAALEMLQIMDTQAQIYGNFPLH